MNVLVVLVPVKVVLQHGCGIVQDSISRSVEPYELGCGSFRNSLSKLEYAFQLILF